MSRRVYVAGPYSDAPGLNVAIAMQAATELLDAGLFPYLPHLTHFWHAAHPRPYETWMGLDFAWVVKCDALLRLPGQSPGADREATLAAEHGIPVFHSTRDLLAWAGA